MYKYDGDLTVEEFKTKLFKTSRPKSALMIKEACDKEFFFRKKGQDSEKSTLCPLKIY